jgi:hypothetical protein
MEFLLVVMFYINGPEQPPVFVDGFLPIGFASESECQTRLEFATGQLPNIVPPGLTYDLNCFQKLKVGNPT